MTIQFNTDILNAGTEALVKIAGDNLTAPISAIIGNPTTGEVVVSSSDKKGLVWIHGVGSEIDSAYTAVSQLTSADTFYGAPVRVRKGTNGYIIESTDPDTAPQFFSGAESRNDQTSVYPNQVMYGNLHPVSGTLQLLVIGAVYNGELIQDQYTADFGTNTVQDTASANIVQPTNNNRSIAILVQIDSAGELTYKQSSEFVASISLAQAWRNGLLPEPDGDRFRVGYVKFTTGATSFSYADISKESPETSSGNRIGVPTTINGTYHIPTDKVVFFQPMLVTGTLVIKGTGVEL